MKDSVKDMEAATGSTHMIVVLCGTGGAPVATEIRLIDDGTGLGHGVVELLDGSNAVRAADAPTPVTEADIDVTLSPLADIDGVFIEGPWGDDTVPASIHAVADRLLTRLTHHQLDRPVSECRIHAAAVVDAQGTAALLLGHSGSGKSTLAAHLVHGGFDLLNDEQITLCRSDGSVGGFTRPVAIKAGGAGALPLELAELAPDPDCTWLLPIRALNPAARHRLSARPVVSVMLGRDHVLAEPGQVEARPGSVRVEPVPPVEAFAMFCAHNLDLVRKPAEALADLAWLAATVPTVRLVYEDADVAANAVRQLLDDPPSSPAAEWAVSSPKPDQHADSLPAPAIVAVDGRVLVEIDSEAFVYEPGERRLVALTADGVTLWRALPWRGVVSPELRAFAEALVEVGVVRFPDESGA